MERGGVQAIPSRGTGWSCLLAILAGGASVAMGSAKMSGDAMLNLIAAAGGVVAVAESREVGFSIELVKSGGSVLRPWISRFFSIDPVVSGVLSLGLGSICAVPKRKMLVITWTVAMVFGLFWLAGTTTGRDLASGSREMPDIVGKFTGRATPWAS